jgi:hypothetical protein
VTMLIPGRIGRWSDGLRRPDQIWTPMAHECDKGAADGAVLSFLSILVLSLAIVTYTSLRCGSFFLDRALSMAAHRAGQACWLGVQLLGSRRHRARAKPYVR